MALNDYETSANLGIPVELYEIRTSASAVLRYTDVAIPITYAGEVYTPHPIQRSKLESQSKFDLLELKLDVPFSSPLGELFLFYPPSYIVTVTVRQGHIDDPAAPAGWEAGENFPVAFAGRVVEAQRDGDTAKLSCEHIGASMKRPGLRRHYQWACPLVLYGPRCQAPKTSWRVEIIGANANTLTVNIAGVDPLPPSGTTLGQFVGGFVQWDADRGKERRSILRMDATTIWMDGPAYGVPYLNSEGDIFRGCPHTLQGCTDIHDNAVNYGGQPWIPTDGNPIGRNNHF